LFTKSQFATHAQHVLHLNNAHAVTSDRGLAHPLKGSGAVEKGLTAMVYALVKCLFRPGTEHTRVYKCPHVWRSKRLKSGDRGGCTLKTVCGRIDMNTFPCLVVGKTEVCRSMLGTRHTKVLV